jgi:hypothetical protein
MPSGLKIIPGRIEQVLLNLPALKRAQDLRPAGKAVVRAVRESVGAEFANQAWSAPDGSIRPWARNVPFGKALEVAAGEKKPLVRTGGYFEALMGRGAGAVEVVTAKTVTVGVDTTSFPFAGAIRGGTGADIRTAPLIIRPKKRVAGWQPLTKSGKPRAWQTQWSMWWRLGLELGVWLSARTMRDGLRLPPRPHLTRNPRLTAKAAKIYGSYVASGAIGV